MVEKFNSMGTFKPNKRLKSFVKKRTKQGPQTHQQPQFHRSCLPDFRFLLAPHFHPVHHLMRNNPYSPIRLPSHRFTCRDTAFSAPFTISHYCAVRIQTGNIISASQGDFHNPNPAFFSKAVFLKLILSRKRSIRTNSIAHNPSTQICYFFHSLRASGSDLANTSTTYIHSLFVLIICQDF